MIPEDIAAVVRKLGEVEWGATAPLDADGHAANTKKSVERTAENFSQEGPQRMHGLYLKGSETVLCHTGTSPNSPISAQALCGAWNRLVEICQAQEKQT